MRPKDIASRITKCRTRLLLDSPWFGSLAMRLRIESMPGLGTFATDGQAIMYDPTFAATLTDEEITAVMAHEILHCALLHPFRLGNRDRMQANISMDYVINIELNKAGFKLPAGCIPPDMQYDRMAWEQVYALRQKAGNPNPFPNGAGDGSGQPTGQVMPSPGSGNGKPGQGGQGQTPASGQMTESDWKIAVESVTNVCKGCGKVPGGFEELVKSTRASVADWRAILREFVENTVPSDYSWACPNRRHIANGLYLPGVTKENLGHVAIAVDTSGSIDSALLAAFCTELNSIVGEAKPDRVSVIYCDSKVHRTDEFGQDEPITMHAVGRGGTAFSPVFESISKWDSPPVCLIFFTDLDSSDTPSEPEYPVLWATSECVTGNGPFGRTVRIAEAR